MTGPPLYPVALDLAGVRCLVVGGGAVAARKVAGLLDAGALVTVVTPELTPALEALVGADAIEWEAAAVTIGDAGQISLAPSLLSGCRVVVAATSDPEVNHALAVAARASGALVNDVTQRRGGDFALPAVHRQGPVTVTVSTDGISPGAAGWLRDLLAAEVPAEAVAALELLAEVVAELEVEQGAEEGVEGGAEASTSGSGGAVDAPAEPGTLRVMGHRAPRRARPDWRELVDSGMLDDIREGRRASAKERLKACLSSSSD